MECRITSEDPANGFLPSTGTVTFLRPPAGPGVRWDGGIGAGDEITLFYDSLLGKLIVWGNDRAQAIDRMTRALSELLLAGVSSNLPFHCRLMRDPEFREGRFDTQFLERRTDLLEVPMSDDHKLVAAVAAALAEEEARVLRRPPVAAQSEAPSVWARVARREALG
jgi:acetyl-CoA carboxylase, biotin carboxylase subunit